MRFPKIDRYGVNSRLIELAAGAAQRETAKKTQARAAALSRRYAVQTREDLERLVQMGVGPGARIKFFRPATDGREPEPVEREVGLISEAGMVSLLGRKGLRISAHQLLECGVEVTAAAPKEQKRRVKKFW